MEKIKDFYSDYRDYILFVLSIIIFLMLTFFIFYYFRSNINNLEKKIRERPVVEVMNNKSSSEKLIVDIKGEVKRPGVYYLDKGKRVIDVVNKAGGFTRDADSFVNNLSMKVKDEMVIVIYSKSEIKDYLNIKKKENEVIEKCKEEIVTNDSCIESSSNEKQSSSSTSTVDKSKSSSSDIKTKDEEVSNKKVSINTATKEELMTLTGIGESKALAIIEYRNKKKFETIEEIKEVSGIGDSLFEKIKDYITT